MFLGLFAAFLHCLDAVLSLWIDEPLKVRRHPCHRVTTNGKFVFFFRQKIQSHCSIHKSSRPSTNSPTITPIIVTASVADH